MISAKSSSTNPVAIMGIQRQNGHHDQLVYQQIAITYNVRLRDL